MHFSTLFALAFAATVAMAQSSPATGGAAVEAQGAAEPARRDPGCFADCVESCGDNNRCRSSCNRICRDPWGPGGPLKKAKRDVVEPKRVDPICYGHCASDCGNDSKCKGDCIRICRDPWGPGGPRKVKRNAEPQRNCSEQRMCMRRCRRDDDACRDACSNIPCY